MYLEELKVYIIFSIILCSMLVFKIMQKHKKTQKIYKKYKILKFMLSIIIKYYKYTFHKWVYNKIVHIEKKNNLYMIPYYINSTEYKFPIRVNPNHIVIKEIMSFNDEDVMCDIRPYIGHSGDFHNIMLTPNDLGYKYLKFIIKNNNNMQTLEFNQYDIINFEQQITDIILKDICNTKQLIKNEDVKI